jgi:ABC-type dipeptide/oligopeptide/nickel transport system permease subunit
VTVRRVFSPLPLLGSFFLVVFFVGYGVLPFISQTLTRVWHLIYITFTGQIGLGYYSIYYGVSWLHIWYTVRLIAIALVFAYLIGIILLIISSKLKWRPLAAIIEVIATLFESVPDTFYIILTVLLVVYLIEYFGINIPAFNNMNPTWSDTWIPALALALPGGFYLRRLFALQLRDEMSSRYVETARSKGASWNRIYYRHMVPNLGPTAISQIPFVATMILSTAVFAEFFMEYQGQLFQFTNAAALSLEKGDMEGLYRMGTLVVIGFLLVLLWWFFRVLSGLGQHLLYPTDLVRTAGASTRKVSWGWIIVGAVMVSVILFFGLFPHLLTPFSPTHKDTGSLSQVGPPFVPLPPSHRHPFGTDQLGHDILAMGLAGVYHSLMPAVLITLATLVISFLVSVFAFSSTLGWPIKVLRLASETLSALPALFVLFLALYHRIDTPWLQLLQFISWITVIEVGRISYTFYETLHGWQRFGFIEGAQSIGRTRLGILFSHLRSWLGRYLLELSFVEFVRVTSIMTQLAAFHIYSQVAVGLLLFKQPNEHLWPDGFVSMHPSWFGMIGDSTLSLNFLSYPNYLAVPLIMLAVTVVGMNLIARGIRGHAVSSER